MSVTGSASSTNNLNVLKGKIASLAPYAVDPTLSVEGAAAEAKAVGDALEKKLDNTDIVDNLTTSDSNKVLSAKQGNVLKKSVDDLRVNTEESIGNIEQSLTDMGVTITNAQNSAENAATNADNAQAEAEKKLDPDGSVAMTADFNMDGHNILNLADPVEETDAANKKFVDETAADNKLYADKKAFYTNLADNTDFTQFIAQAGICGKHGETVYAGDRWKLSSGTFVAAENEGGNGYSSCVLNGTIEQIVANAPDEAFCGVEMISGEASISYSNGILTITSEGGVLKGALLIEGEYTEENKPKYQPKGYGAELAECQRYFVQLKYDMASQSRIMGIGITSNDNKSLNIFFPLPVQLRAVPSVIFTTPAYMYGAKKADDVTEIASVRLIPSGIACNIRTNLSDISGFEAVIVSFATLSIIADL